MSPVARHPLSEREKTILLLRIDDLLRFLGAPGDWGYGSQLATITQGLAVLRDNIDQSPARSRP